MPFNGSWPLQEEFLTLRASRRGHSQARGWRLQGNSWRHGKVLQIALRGGLGSQKILLESSWRVLGGSLGRLGGSWRALGASWAVLKTSGEVLGRPWGHIRGVLSALRRIPTQLSAIIGANRVPKWTPGGGQNGVQNRVWLKMLKS